MQPNKIDERTFHKIVQKTEELGMVVTFKYFLFIYINNICNNLIV